MEVTPWPDFMPTRHDWSESFWLGLADSKLQLAYCPVCDQLEYPPVSPRCRNCHQALTWKSASGNARLWSWTTIHRVYYPDYPLEPPYTVLMVELDEGISMLATLVPDYPTDSLACNQALDFKAIEISPGVLVPGFVPRNTIEPE